MVIRSPSAPRRKWEGADGSPDVQVPFSTWAVSFYSYFSECPLEADSHRKITPLIIFPKKRRFSKFPNYPMRYLSVWKMPETVGLGTDRCFFGASEEESTYMTSYCLRYPWTCYWCSSDWTDPLFFYSKVSTLASLEGKALVSFTN